MKAVKANKEYKIHEAEKQRYQDEGFDILDDTGKVIAYGKGKTVPYGDYAALKAENERLKAKLTEVEVVTPKEEQTTEKKTTKKVTEDKT